MWVKRNKTPALLRYCLDWGTFQGNRIRQWTVTGVISLLSVPLVFRCLSTSPRRALSFLSFISWDSTRSLSFFSRSPSAMMCCCLWSCCLRYLSRCSLATSTCCWCSICCCCLAAMSWSSDKVRSTPPGSCFKEKIKSTHKFKHDSPFF